MKVKERDATRWAVVKKVLYSCGALNPCRQWSFEKRLQIIDCWRFTKTYLFKINDFILIFKFNIYENHSVVVKRLKDAPWRLTYKSKQTLHITDTRPFVDCCIFWKSLAPPEKQPRDRSYWALNKQKSVNLILKDNKI